MREDGGAPDLPPRQLGEDGVMRTWRMPGRDRLAMLAALAAPLALAAVLVPWRASFPNPMLRWC